MTSLFLSIGCTSFSRSTTFSRLNIVLKLPLILLLLSLLAAQSQANPVLVKDIDINATLPESTVLRRSASVDGILYFNASDLEHDDELWKSDGTSAGTKMVKNVRLAINDWSKPVIYPGIDPYDLITEVNGKLYFTDVYELWTSDGTEAGTVMVMDINPGSYSRSWSQNLTNVNGTLFFSANDGVHGRELWKLDTTQASLPSDRWL